MSPDERARYERAYMRDWHAKNRDRVAEMRSEKRERLRSVLMEYFGSHPCVDCGERDPAKLEFDHRDPSEKGCDVSKLVSKVCGLDRLLSEIEKCDVRCANCHRVRTALQFNHWTARGRNGELPLFTDLGHA